jgi:hypothetical protein
MPLLSWKNQGSVIVKNAGMSLNLSYIFFILFSSIYHAMDVILMYVTLMSSMSHALLLCIISSMTSHTHTHTHTHTKIEQKCMAQNPKWDSESMVSSKLQLIVPCIIDFTLLVKKLLHWSNWWGWELSYSCLSFLRHLIITLHLHLSD